MTTETFTACPSCGKRISPEWTLRLFRGRRQWQAGTVDAHTEGGEFCKEYQRIRASGRDCGCDYTCQYRATICPRGRSAAGDGYAFAGSPAAEKIDRLLDLVAKLDRAFNLNPASLDPYDEALLLEARGRKET